MKRIAIVSMLSLHGQKSHDLILCYVNTETMLEKNQMVEYVPLFSRAKHSKGQGYVVSYGLIDEKLTDSCLTLQVDYYISAVYHKEYTGSNLGDFI